MKETFHIYQRSYWPNKDKKPTWGIYCHTGGKYESVYGLFATRAVAREMLKEIKRMHTFINKYVVAKD